MSKKESSYYFIARLTDRYSNYNVQEKVITPNLKIDIFADHIYIWGTTDLEFEVFKTGVVDTIDTIVATYAFLTQRRIGYVVENWIEAKKVTIKESVEGVIRDENIHASSEKADFNLQWQVAVEIYRNILIKERRFKLAIKDFRSSVNDPMEDGILYMYRALENVRRIFSKKEDMKAAWLEMHQRLGTQEIPKLTKAAEAVRHGSVDEDIVREVLKDKSLYLIEVKKTIDVGIDAWLNP